MNKRTDVAALIIGRGNNTLKDKNILPVFNRPLLQWGALAAKRSKYIGSYYISSDCDKILSAGGEVGFTKILRPEILSLATSQSSDVVRHAAEFIERQHKISTLVVIHANVGTISSEMIDECLEKLFNNEAVSSVVPCHRKDEYHPLRAKKITSQGLLTPFVDSGNSVVSANRQDLEPCLFFDHSFWVLDVQRGVKSEDGQGPWPVMGRSIMPYVTTGCFDVHDIEDLKKTEEWIESHNLLTTYKLENLI